MNARRLIKAVGAIGLLTLVSAPASAYICTGSGPGQTNEFQDPDCDADEISLAIGATFDDTLLAKDEDPENNPGVGSGGSTQWGTLEVTTPASTEDGTVTFSWVPLSAGISPQVIVEKADGWYSVYDWLTQVTPLGGNLYSITREFPTSEFCEAVGVTCSAETSHVSAYGVVPLPAAVWLLGGALIGLVGVARRKAA